MKYTKSVIALVFEIRKKVPPQFRDNIKLSNPQLDIEFIGLYKTTDDVIVQALIKEVLLQMGSESIGLISPQTSQTNKTQKNKPRKKVKIYRGKEIEMDNLEASEEPPILKTLASSKVNEDGQRKKAKRIYRGKVVED